MVHAVYINYILKVSESILSSFSLVVLSKWGPPVINKISLECRHSEILLIRIGSNFKCIQPLFSVEVSNKKVVSYKVIDHLIRTDTEPLLSHTQSYCSMCLPLLSNITPSKRGPHEVTGIYILLRADHASAHLGGRIPEPHQRMGRWGSKDIDGSNLCVKIYAYQMILIQGPQVNSFI